MSIIVREVYQIFTSRITRSVFRTNELIFFVSINDIRVSNFWHSLEDSDRIRSDFVIGKVFIIQSGKDVVKGWSLTSGHRRGQKGLEITFDYKLYLYSIVY